jgi:hypothetical protein
VGLHDIVDLFDHIWAGLRARLGPPSGTASAFPEELWRHERRRAARSLRPAPAAGPDGSRAPPADAALAGRSWARADHRLRAASLPTSAGLIFHDLTAGAILRNRTGRSAHHSWQARSDDAEGKTVIRTVDRHARGGFRRRVVFLKTMTWRWRATSFRHRRWLSAQRR